MGEEYSPYFEVWCIEDYMIIDNLQSSLKIMRKKHPEAQNLIDIFTPILICEEELLEELKMKKPALSLKKQKEKVPYVDVKDFPVCSEKSHIICQKLLQSMKTALPHLNSIIEEIVPLIKPSTARRLCKEFIANKENHEELLEKFIEKNFAKDKLADETYFTNVYSVLELLLTRASHTLLARFARSLPVLEDIEETQICPVCSGKPNMSVIRFKEGQRELLCADCGTLWRYKRSKCHICGKEEDKNLEMTYADKNKNERALTCQACKNYILEIDLRDQEIDKENAHIYSLGMAYLDAIMQK